MYITCFRLKKIYAFLDNSKKYKIKHFDCKINRKKKKEKLIYYKKKKRKRYSKFSFLLKIITNDY